MKIAVSSMENHLDAPYLLIINTDTLECEVISNLSLSHIGRPIRSYIQEIVRKNVNILIAGHCSKKDIEDFYLAGIKVYHGREDSVRNIVKTYNEGFLLPCIHSKYLHNKSENKSHVQKNIFSMRI